MNKINLNEAEMVNGGNDGMPSNKWVYGTVHGVVAYDSTACLALRNAPNGSVQYNSVGTAYGWQNGQSICVLPSSRKGDWIKARMGSLTGWVNANYVTY